MRRRRRALQRREEGVKNKRLDLYNITEYFAVSAFFGFYISTAQNLHVILFTTSCPTPSQSGGKGRAAERSFGSHSLRMLSAVIEALVFIAVYIYGMYRLKRQNEAEL